MCIVDFTDVSEVLVFTSNISRLCVNVTITEDDLVERDEYFTVSLSTDLEFPVNLYPNSSKEITIVNDDCKLLYLSHDVIIVSMHCVQMPIYLWCVPLLKWWRMWDNWRCVQC